MVSLANFEGNAMKASFQKKKEKLDEKMNAIIVAAEKKLAPLRLEAEKLDAMIQVLDEHEQKALGLQAKEETESDASESEKEPVVLP